MPQKIPVSRQYIIIIAEYIYTFLSQNSGTENLVGIGSQAEKKLTEPINATYNLRVIALSKLKAQTASSEGSKVPAS